MIRKATLLEPAEKFVLKITAVLFAADMILILVRGTQINVLAYSTVTCFVALMFSLGFFYRLIRPSEKIAAMTMCTGAFILFTANLSLFNYLLTPNSNPPIDHLLIQIDSLYGYHWPDIVEWASRHEWLNQFMRFSYIWTLPEIAVLLIALSMTGNFRDLHSLIITIAIAGTVTVLFWSVFPSLGPSAYFQLPEDIIEKVRPVVGTTYGATILEQLKNGSDILSPNEFRGMVAFPSFHIVLAAIATYHARNLRFLFVPFVIVNAAVVPGVLVHGGHHVIDIPAGFILFAFTLYVSRLLNKNENRTIQNLYKQPNQQSAYIS